jgi:predicted nucleic acid-binding protein
MRDAMSEMRQSLEQPSPLVIDASAAVWLVLPIVAPIDLTDRFVAWRIEGRPLVAPMLWLAEGASAIRRAVFAGHISEPDGQRALEDLLMLPVDKRPMTAEHCRAAFAWATRLGHARVYDAVYLALAEELTAELWTADKRLASGAAQAGASWVRWIGEDAAPTRST